MIEKYKLFSCFFFTAVWVQLCATFIFTEIIPGLEGKQSYLYLLSDMVYLILGLVTIRNRRDVFVVGAFYAIAVISAVVNHQGIIVFLNGSREFFGLLFMAPIIRYFLSGDYADRFVRSVDRQLYVFLWIQLPCLLFQFMKYGAGDQGGGSLGYGCSGIVTTLIFLISFYLVNKRWDETRSYVWNIYNNRVLVLLLFMTILNETKIGFIYIILYFIFLMKIDRRFIFRLLMSVPLVIVLFSLMSYLYLTVTNANSDTFNEELFIDYFVGTDMDALVDMAVAAQYDGTEFENIIDLPRFGRFLLLPEIFDSCEGGYVLGAGIGQFKGGSVLETTELSSSFQWLLSGSVITIFFIVVQLGIVGLVWIVCTIISLLFTPDKQIRGNSIFAYMAVLFVLTFIYNDSLRIAYVCFVMSYVCMYGLQPYVGAVKKTL